MRRRVFVTAIVCLSCGLDRDPLPPIIHARFDPDEKVIPMPTNVLRDDVAGMLDLPTDDEDLNDAEREFFSFLNSLDGWSSTMQATVEFTGEIDAATVTAQSLQVWEWAGVPRRVNDVTINVTGDGRKLTIDPPRTGWTRGATYVVLMTGGEDGVRGVNRETVECDAAFYFLRLTEELDTPEHERAFPGDTRAERQDNAGKLEELRAELAPYFQYFENNGIERAQVAALWSFTVTTRVELAMDKASQRMPLPFDLLIDAAGKIDLPPAAWDSVTVTEAKRRLREYDGFGTSMSLMFQFTGPVEVATVNELTVELWALDGVPRKLGIDVRMLDDLESVVVTPDDVPLPEQARFAVVVREGIRDADGVPIVPMPVGHFMRSLSPVLVDGASQIDAIDAEDAERVERARGEVAPFLDQVGRGGVLTAWPFTTMTIRSGLEEATAQAETLAVTPHPIVTGEMTPADAAADFPLGSLTLFQVDRVVNGTIASPVYLDPVTRGWRETGQPAIDPIAFTMTIPDGLTPGEPLPVVIFGHGLMTERRFVLALGDRLAQRGYAAISIDFPYHGTRTACSWSGPICFPNTTTGEIVCPDPCQSGTTCAPDGRCVDAAGNGNYLAEWPIVNFPQASGAAFIEVEYIANTRDHFKQAVVDLGSLLRSLQQGDWNAAIGHPIDTAKIHYAGQSLGGIIGATWVTLEPDIRRAVLNVPGADTVDMFSSSPAFGGHVDAFLVREDIEPGSFDEERFMNVARWFMDATDPMNQATHILEGGRAAMIQMATLDAVIPNPYTLVLEELSGVPRRDYIAEHAFITFPAEPAFPRGMDELTGFLDGTFAP